LKISFIHCAGQLFKPFTQRSVISFLRIWAREKHRQISATDPAASEDVREQTKKDRAVLADSIYRRLVAGDDFGQISFLIQQ